MARAAVFLGWGWGVHTLHLAHTVTACTCAENPRLQTGCVRLRVDRLTGQPGRPSAAQRSQKRRDRNTHRDPLPLFKPHDQSELLLLFSSSGSNVRFAWRCASTLTPRSSSVHCRDHCIIYRFIVADKLASKRNSNDLIIFLAMPAHRRLRPVSVSGLSADGRLSEPIRNGLFFFFGHPIRLEAGPILLVRRKCVARRAASTRRGSFHPAGGDKAPMLKRVASQ